MNVKDVLARALPETPPPGSISRDSAIAAGRRAVRRRRAQLTWLSAAAGTLIVALGSGVLLTPDGGGTDPAGAAPTAGTGVPTPVLTTETAIPTPDGPRTLSPPPPTLASLPPEPPINRPPTESGTVTANRLTTVFQAAVANALPGTSFRPVTIHFTTGTQTPPALKVLDRGGYLLAFAETRDPAGIGQLELHIAPYIGDNTKRPFATYCHVVEDFVNDCTTSLGPNGERIIAQTGHPSSLSPLIEYRADVVRPDGTALTLVTRNMSDNSGGDVNSGPAQRSSPPLSMAQMVAILLTPGLTLYP